MIEAGCDVFLQQDHRPLLPILRACMREDRYPRLAEITVLTFGKHTWENSMSAVIQAR
jgi:non-heme chloroperoxidase